MVCSNLLSLFFTSSLNSIVSYPAVFVKGVPSIFKYVLINVRIQLNLTTVVALVIYQLAAWRILSAGSCNAANITSSGTGAGLVKTLLYEREVPAPSYN